MSGVGGMELMEGEKKGGMEVGGEVLGDLNKSKYYGQIAQTEEYTDVPKTIKSSRYERRPIFVINTT